MSESKSINISQSTIKRLLKDLKEIKKNPLHSHGIYYEHDDSNILKGQALIIGPKNTPYQYGYYLFNFEFPTDYPHNPPKVKYLTNDGNTRFNPNLYKCGKVCLSILNTWRGEAWTGCQTLSTTLLTFITIFHNMPLINEPGIDANHPSNKPYNEIITYKNFDTAICYMLTEYPKKNNKHYDIMKSLFLENYNDIRNIILSKPKNSFSEYSRIYNLTQLIDYNDLLNNIDNLYIKLK